MGNTSLTAGWDEYYEPPQAVHPDGVYDPERPLPDVELGPVPTASECLLLISIYCEIYVVAGLVSFGMILQVMTVLLCCGFILPFATACWLRYDYHQCASRAAA